MTMIERVARAIALDEYPDGNIEDVWMNYLPVARAVLTSIREPSEGMMAAVDARSYGQPLAAYELDNMNRDAAVALAEVWTAMIDAALAEGNT